MKLRWTMTMAAGLLTLAFASHAQPVPTPGGELTPPGAQQPPPTATEPAQTPPVTPEGALPPPEGNTAPSQDTASMQPPSAAEQPIPQTAPAPAPAAPSPQAAPPVAGSSVSVASEDEAAEGGYQTVVVGTPEARTSGSLHIVKAEALERFELDDPHAILHSVPGVYVRGEDGFGLRPNIGLRGANSDRSKKVTLLEDGVLFGPAPYSAPAAYYFPLMTRMVAVRVLKGPSAISQGPHTVGGSVELITRDIPEPESFGVDIAGGQHKYGKAHVYYGAGTEKFGFLVEGVHLRNGGFKQLDGGGNTGFYRNEWMLKARRRFDSEQVRQSLNLKLGLSTEVSNETYLGLSDADFEARPLRRYVASQFDRMENFRTEAALRHQIEWGQWDINTTVYRNDFNRTWRKVNHFEGAPVSTVLADPDSPVNNIYYRVLTGQDDSSNLRERIWIGPNRRVFVSQGVQSLARTKATTGPVAHSLELGARLHYDGIRRLHTEDRFRMQGGHLVFDGAPTATSADNRESTYALALHLIDAMSFGPFVLTPGVRWEKLRSKSVDRLGGTVQRGSVSILLPGVGLYANVVSDFGIFGGVYRGFSPPAPGQPESVSPETSINYEAGLRWASRGQRFEVVGFFNDYTNLTDICTFSNGCLNENLDRQTDAGEAIIYGLEAYAEKSFKLGGGLTLPLTAAYTLTRTRLEETFNSADPQFGSVTTGDELPYVPRHQLTASIGLQSAAFGLYGSATYVGEMREEAGQGPIPDGVRTEPLLTFDASASWHFAKGAQLYVNGRNLANELKIVSRRPYGARPNAPRELQVGLKYSY